MTCMSSSGSNYQEVRLTPETASSWSWMGPVRTSPRRWRSRRTSAGPVCLVRRPNLIRRNMGGMSFGRRHFRTGRFRTGPGWREPWRWVGHGWRWIEIAWGASALGLGWLGSTGKRFGIRRLPYCPARNQNPNAVTQGPRGHRLAFWVWAKICSLNFELLPCFLYMPLRAHEILLR